MVNKKMFILMFIAIMCCVQTASALLYCNDVLYPGNQGVTGYAPLIIDFYYAGLSNSTTIAWKYSDTPWDYGATSTHTFNASTGFFVETWAPGSHGTAYIKVNVLPQSVANFTASPEIGCAPLNVSFTDCSTNATYREWDFGDGSPKMINVLNPVHTYAQPGNYTVSLMVHGSTKGTFGWDNNTATKVISVYGVPVSGFSKSITVTFTDQSQYADTVLWDFGDGSTSTERNPTHTYAASGTYNITQTTSNPAGSSVSSSVITI